MNKIVCVISPGEPHHAVVMGGGKGRGIFICYLAQLFHEDSKDIQLPFKASVGCGESHEYRQIKLDHIKLHKPWSGNRRHLVIIKGEKKMCR